MFTHKNIVRAGMAPILTLLSFPMQVANAGDHIECNCGNVQCSVTCETGIATAACGNGKFDGSCLPSPDARQTSPNANVNNHLTEGARLVVYCQLVRHVQRVSGFDFKAVSRPLREVVGSKWKREGEQWNLNFQVSSLPVEVMLMGLAPEGAFRDLNWAPVEKLESSNLSVDVSDDEFNKRIREAVIDQGHNF